ncbi:MAG: UDP-N-acetylmuramoyl-L-alanyl-D-glutamate--2,6-diaminopimelate ligase [Gammaproteobacteria bacterium]|nr:UDP-N-acetylmuramoyl-L-alanyl-D-glutamate--2,6-diaminopimelate ligase [Gammaproteobacteria bacterium]
MSAGKKLSELLAGIGAVSGAQDRLVQALTLDSRAVSTGALFVALPGARHDGRTFLTDVAARGVAAIVYEANDFVPSVLPVPAIGVHGLADHLGTIADRFYDAPSRRLVVVGVTGTNGKTTCTQLLAQALDRPPRRCGIIGTLGYGFPGALDAGLHTTPDALAVHRLLAEFVAASAAHVSMEVSSHALDQGRVNAVAFEVAVFTNLSRDHLDYHGAMEHYAAAKTRLFTCAGLKTAVINGDDEHGRKLIDLLAGRARVIAYGRSAGDVYARSLKCSREGLQLIAATPQGDVEIRAPLFGEFNALNLVAVLATLLALGLDATDAAQRLAGARPVPGRVERFGGGVQPLVMIDYAHTPDALEQVLQALRPHVSGQLWCVFGCGGNRDRGKRPQMGAIAERLADVVILTDDNPRHEAGATIIDEIRAGMRQPARVIRDRRAAITAALSEAASDDVVLIAGKGHEDYQQIGDTRHPYSDRDTVRELLGRAA